MGNKQYVVLDWVAALITGIWSASMIIDMFSKRYTPPLMIHFVLMTIVGFVFGFKHYKESHK